MHRHAALALYLALAALVALPSLASAQEEGPLPSPGQGDPQEARALYDDAFSDLRARRWDAAQEKLARYLSLYPKGELAYPAQELLRLAQHLARQEERVEGSGRVELVAFSTTYGIGAGLALWSILELERPGLLLSFATGGLGLGLSLYTTSGREVSDGDAATISNAGLWGTWNGLAIPMILGNDDSRVILSSGIGVGLLGIGGGVLLNHLYAPHGGDVGLTSSGGLWGTFFAGMGLLVAEPDDPSSAQIFGTLLAGSDLGLLGGAFLATHLDLPRSRTRLIDLGGTLGALLGGGLVLLSDDAGPRLTGSVMGAGGLAGLGLAAWATSGWDEPKTKDTSLLLLDSPSPFVLPASPDKPTAVGLHLVQGRW